MLHVGIAGPIATENIAEHLEGGGMGLPAGYRGAPLMGVLIGELLRLGHRVSAFTTDNTLPIRGEPVIARGGLLTVYYCPSRRRTWRFNAGAPGRALDGFARERRHLTNVIRAAKPDLIHAHWTYEFALAALDAGLPHLITCHDDPWVILRHSRSVYRAVRYFMARQVYRRAAALTAVSPYMAKAVRRYTQAPLDIVPNPLANYVMTSGRLRAQAAGMRIGMVLNGWSDFKNPEPALRAFAAFRARHPAAELHCFGHDFGAGEIAQRWAEANGLDQGVLFHGALPHQELIARLSQLDALLHPALEESFGVVIAEAMALGLPIVAGAVSGAVPWVVGQGELPEPLPAVLADARKPEALNDGLEALFNADRYGARSAASIARAHGIFSANAVVQAYLDQYSLLLGKTTKMKNRPVIATLGRI